MVTENVHVILWYGFLSQLFKLHWGKKSKQDKAGQDKTTGCSSPALLQHFSLVLQRPWNLLAVTLLPVNSGS